MLETVTFHETNTTALRVMPTPMNEVKMGMPAVSSDLNVIAKIMKEINNPIISGTLLVSEFAL